MEATLQEVDSYLSPSSHRPRGILQVVYQSCRVPLSSGACTGIFKILGRLGVTVERAATVACCVPRDTLTTALCTQLNAWQLRLS